MSAAKKSAKAPRQSYYTFDALQSAQIEQIRLALRGLSQIACDGNLDAPMIEIERPNMAALFELLDDRLGDVIGPDRCGTVWVDEDPAP